ncbi:MAG: glycoside hydrolase [Clostridia bacterium]|nr:glycoside hydrolase [Clostridia bacterium]
MRKKIVILILVLLISLTTLAGCGNITEGRDYTIPLIDLESKPEGLDSQYAYLFDERTIVDPENTTDYLAHPDSVLIKDSNGTLNTILTMFPEGHGKGNVKVRVSSDKGKSYSKPDDINVPASWAKSQETPTVYRLIFNKDNIPSSDDKLIMISGNPDWYNDPKYKKNGFNASISSDEGKNWTEFETILWKRVFRKVEDLQSVQLRCCYEFSYET